MRIYARKSLIGEVDTEKMFDVIESGIKFYQEFFGTPYPFAKYDTVFVPEQCYGAMDSLGVLTSG